MKMKESTADEPLQSNDVALQRMSRFGSRTLKMKESTADEPRKKRFISMLDSG